MNDCHPDLDPNQAKLELAQLPLLSTEQRRHPLQPDHRHVQRKVLVFLEVIRDEDTPGRHPVLRAERSPWEECRDATFVNDAPPGCMTA